MWSVSHRELQGKYNMTIEATAATRRTNVFRIAARLVVVCWAAFWTYFLGANLIDNSSTAPASEKLKGYIFIISGLLLVWSLTILAWRKQKIGGLMLLILGALLFTAYLIFPPQNIQIADRLTTAFLLGALPFVGGVLFLCSVKARR